MPETTGWPCPRKASRNGNQFLRLAKKCHFLSEKMTFLDYVPLIYQNYQINISRINTTPRPTIDVVNSNRPHVLNVSLIDKLKYSLNSQNDASLTCVIVLLPAAVAKTISTGLTSNVWINGPTIPAAVIADTTPVPVAIQITAVISHAIINGLMDVFCITPAIRSPIPVSKIIC